MVKDFRVIPKPEVQSEKLKSKPVKTTKAERKVPPKKAPVPKPKAVAKASNMAREMLKKREKKQ